MILFHFCHCRACHPLQSWPFSHSDELKWNRISTDPIHRRSTDVYLFLKKMESCNIGKYIKKIHTHTDILHYLYSDIAHIHKTKCHFATYKLLYPHNQVYLTRHYHQLYYDITGTRAFSCQKINMLYNSFKKETSINA